jgi:hypothetical protein
VVSLLSGARAALFHAADGVMVDLESLNELPWDRIDIGRFAFWGSIFTVGLDLVIYPLELLKTKVQVETKVRRLGDRAPVWFRRYAAYTITRCGRSCA